MSDYKTTLSQSRIQTFVDGKKFNLRATDYIGKAWEYIQKDWGKSFMIGALFYFISILAPWMMGGLFIGLYNERTKGEKIEAGTLFKGFDHGMPIFMYLLIMMGIMMAIVILPSILIGLILGIMGESAIAAILAMLLYFAIIVAVLAVTVLFQFALPFIVFGGMDAWPAMQASAKIIKNNFLTVFIFLILLNLLNTLGVMLCFIGVLITIPMTYVAMYYAFEDVFKIEEGAGDGTDEIIEHLV